MRTMPGTICLRPCATWSASNSTTHIGSRSRFSPMTSITTRAWRNSHASRVTVSTGEIGTGRWHFKEILDKGAAQILQTDALVCGGVSEWRKIAATASSYGVTVCPHWFHDLHAQLVAATPNARYVEFFPDDQVLNFRRLIDTQLKAKDGMLILPKTPGLGFGFDEKAVARYALKDGQSVWKMLN